MPLTVIVRLDPDEIRAITRSPDGPAFAELMRRGNNVRNAALQNMRSMGIGAKTGTGSLAASIVVEPVYSGGSLAVRIGSRLPYAIVVHDGHGEIRPKGHPFLRWPNIGGSPRRYKGGKTAAYVFARKVRPMPGKPFLRNALSAAAD